MIHDKNSTNNGFILIQGVLSGGPQIKMIDYAGNHMHTWHIDFFSIWENAEHVIPSSNIPKTHLDYHTQGFWPLEDGSIIVNVGGLGTVKLDWCSNVIWKLDRMAHHSVTPTNNDEYWIPGHISIYDTPKYLLPKNFSAVQLESQLDRTMKNYNDSIMLIDINGNLIKEFSILKSLVDAKLENAIYASLQEVPADPTHINDIEIVTPILAQKINGINSGDILVSIREMHMLAIFDKNNGQLKWYKQGPWVRQHDIDIMPDGKIELYNNRSKSIGEWVSGSQIISYDVDTDNVKVIYPPETGIEFYSPIMGTHQRIENNNLLISEALTGRVFETTDSGQIVWEYKSLYDNEYSALVESAMNIPTDFFVNPNKSCPKGE